MGKTVRVEASVHDKSETPESVKRPINTTQRRRESQDP